jgi:predicted CXXCH cytochrome family protein
VVGSGAQARSYLIDNDGFLFQSPITWYQSKLQWSLSPGYEKHQNHFSRRVDSRCLYCHADQPRPVANTIHQYEKPPFGQLSIGCERCHGPGELHVATPPVGLKPGEEDLTIVNPKHLTPALRDNVCEQCHLQGEAIVVRRGRSQLDYRPGLPLHEYMSVFVRSPDLADAGKIVTHFEQMHLSACYTKSGGRFTCTSCHDPHAMPAAGENEAFYRRRCLNCHDTDRKDNNAAPACALPLAKRTANDGRDNCLACHMPRQPSSNAIHLAVTDHRVLRHPGRPGPAKAAPAASGVPLVHFHRHHLSPDDEAHTRDLGIALVELATIGQGSVQEYLVKRALPYLDKATTHAPDDVAALEARGFALYAAGQPAEALRVLADVLGRVPDREFALAWATHIADASGRVDLAEEYGRRLVARYPHYFEYQNRLAVVYVRKQNWAEAGKAARSAVRLEPFNAEARAVLISVLLATGEHVEARREFDVLGVIDPAHQARIRAWFEERIRR